MRRQKSLRIGVHLANAVVWGPVLYRTHLTGFAAGAVANGDRHGDEPGALARPGLVDDVQVRLVVARQDGPVRGDDDERVVQDVVVVDFDVDVVVARRPGVIAVSPTASAPRPRERLTDLPRARRRRSRQRTDMLSP